MQAAAAPDAAANDYATKKKPLLKIIPDVVKTFSYLLLLLLLELLLVCGCAPFGLDALLLLLLLLT